MADEDIVGWWQHNTRKHRRIRVVKRLPDGRLYFTFRYLGGKFADGTMLETTLHDGYTQEEK